MVNIIKERTLRQSKFYQQPNTCHTFMMDDQCACATLLTQLNPFSIIPKGFCHHVRYSTVGNYAKKSSHNSKESLIPPGRMWQQAGETVLKKVSSQSSKSRRIDLEFNWCFLKTMATPIHKQGFNIGHCSAKVKKSV